MVDLQLNALNNRLMSPKEQKVAAGLSVFLTAALPTSVGVIAFRAQPILANIIKGEAHTLPPLTSFFFNHFQGSLMSLFVLAAVATWVSFKAYHQSSGENQSIKFPELLVALAFSSLISIIYLSLFIFSTAWPVYNKLTER